MSRRSYRRNKETRKRSRRGSVRPAQTPTQPAKTLTKTTFGDFFDLRAFIHKALDFGLGEDGNLAEAHRLAHQVQRLLDDLADGEQIPANTILAQALEREGWDSDAFGL